MKMGDELEPHTHLMEYEKQVFLDTFHDDGLLVMARGLGMERIFTTFLKVYSDSGNLVLLINTNSQEEDYFLEKLRDEACEPMPKVITASYSIADRQKLYLQGGVLFVTSRILVVDMLTKRIPIHLITGILVYNAHRIIDSCQEAFILRLFRQDNEKGFIKAFSSSPTAFMSGFCQVERVMKSLFVRKLFLWPRFHASVVSYFDNHKVDVVELHIKMTPSMVACQMSLLDLIDACVKELKICNPSLQSEDITVENAITRSFDRTIKLLFDQVWHQLGTKTKQLIADIKTLRLVMEYLTQYDCISFYSMVHGLRTSEKVFGSNAGWLFLDAADSLFVSAKERIYGPTPVMRKMKPAEGEAKPAPEKPRPLLLEESPKWEALKDILAEIEETNNDPESKLGSGRVLLAAHDDRTCAQIKEYLCAGSKSLLMRLYNKTLVQKGETSAEELMKSKRFRGKGPGKGKNSKDAVTLTQMARGETEVKGTEERKLDDGEVTEDPGDGYYGVINNPMTVLHPLHGTQDRFQVLRLLQELEPTYVIMYDSDIDFVRQLEVFKASRPGYPLRVYFLMYTGSTEEQKYLTTLRKEKEAFEGLIREKATMVIPEERIKGGTLSRDTTPANATTNSRKGGGNEDSSKEIKKVVVDMREFRSELPSLIHRRGIEIEPVTIEVGDYILTPDICVERKSVSDLIGSLNNGRLYNQCVSMCRFYKRPVLLIEFDPNKPFALMGKSSMYGEMAANDVQARLALLTLHFPRLRILWTQSPYVTAELVEELKVNRAEPDSAVAMAITGETEEDLTSGKYNHNPKEMLLRMPGVTSRNVFAILNHVKDLAELVTLTEERIAEIIDNKQYARLLHQFIHTPVSQASALAQQDNKRKQFQQKGYKRKR